MDTNQWQDLDKIMRYLYENRQGAAWYTVYTSLEMDKQYAESLYEIAKADGYVKIAHKGIEFDIPDPYYVKLTDLGLSFFARTNYAEAHSKRNFPQDPNVVNNTTVSNYSNSIVVTGDKNDTTGSFSSAKEEKGGVFKNQWIVTIIGGLLLTFIIYIIKKHFDIDL